MKKIICVLVIILHTCNGQGFGVNLDWVRGLQDNINQLNQNIRGNVEKLTQDIHKNVQSQLQNVNNGNSMTIMENGQSIIMNSGGISRVIYSSRDSNGQPYVRDSIDRVIGDTLLHSETLYDPVSRSIKENRYTLNLKDPNAKPIPLSK